MNSVWLLCLAVKSIGMHIGVGWYVLFLAPCYRAELIVTSAYEAEVDTKKYLAEIKDKRKAL